MTDTNTTPAAEAVERVAKALQGWDDGVRFRWDDLHPDIQDRYHRQATAAIEAHTAWLRERSRQPDVVEAAARAICIEGLSGDRLLKALREGVSVTTQNRVQAHASLTAALTLLLGTQKEATDADR